MKSSDLLRLLLKTGWYLVRQSGSHLILKHPLLTGTIVFPSHGSKEVGKGLEVKIKKIAGIK